MRFIGLTALGGSLLAASTPTDQPSSFFSVRLTGFAFDVDEFVGQITAPPLTDRDDLLCSQQRTLQFTLALARLDDALSQAERLDRCTFRRRCSGVYGR